MEERASYYTPGGSKCGGGTREMFYLLSPCCVEAGTLEAPPQLPLDTLVQGFRLRLARLQLRKVLVDCLINPEYRKLVLANSSTCTRYRGTKTTAIRVRLPRAFGFLEPIVEQHCDVT